MKLRVLSDLHFEFHKDNGKLFASRQRDKDYDVLVLAGDINIQSGISESLLYLRRAAGSRPIVYIPGNHEYYHSSIDSVKETLEFCISQDEDLYILDNNLVEIDGQRFIGSTLWFRRSNLFEPEDDQLNDFHEIKGFRDWVGPQAIKSSNFLDQTIQSGDVVITHHLPHPESVKDEFRDSDLNKYYLHNLSPLVEDSGVKLWIHGHTHSSLNYQLKDTRVICNPMGYLNFRENYNFNSQLTVEV